MQKNKLSTGSKKANPKDNVGVKKVPISTIPAQVLMEIGLAMLEGARKYGRHNYRVSGVRASVYYDAIFRHLSAYWEGQDIDPDSGLHHIVKAIACLVVLRDAMWAGNLIDDRPPIHQKHPKWIENLNDLAARIISKYPETVQPFTEIDNSTKT